MRNIKILEMLNDNKIEELKTELRDEIYMDSLKEIPTAKKRYIAMKKYFSYTNETREILQKPCKVIVNGIDYTCFTNAKTLALTTENTGEIELLDKAKIAYPDINKFITFAGIKRKINFSKKFAIAKSRGYIPLKRDITNPELSYLLEYDGSYYNLTLVDITYRIIEDCDTALTYHLEGPRNPITIQTGVGICMIMPCIIPYDDPRLGTNQIISFDQSFAFA
ncbi:MAG TPA: hypothetical protein OIM52_17500 [Fusicatenibacter saccharivorans]|nr:hypothetical protein [Fusicatenibacter saccharivorans]